MGKCPVCEKKIHKENLGRHMERFHKAPTEGDGQDKDADGLPPAEELSIERPPEKADGEKTFRCIDCGYEPIVRGAASCPGCGERLEWEAVRG